MTDTDEGAPTFKGDIKSLFRERDRASMLDCFDLWSYDDVNANTDAILAAVRGGSMPCDAPWPSEKVNLLQRWSTVACQRRTIPCPDERRHYRLRRKGTMRLGRLA